MTTNLILATRPATFIFSSCEAWTSWRMGTECPPPLPAESPWGARALEHLSLKLTSTLQTCLTS